MKKWSLLLIVPILIFSLVGCEEGTSRVSTDFSTNEIVQNTIEKSKSIKSMHLLMTLTQDMSLGERSLVTSSIIEMEYTSDPIAAYQSMTNQDMDMIIEMYITKDGTYAKGVDESNQWYILDQSLTDDLIKKAESQNSALALENLKDFADSFTVSEEDDKYILELDASGDEYTEVIKNEFTKNMPADMPIDELMESTKINKAQYKILVDKESFIMKELSLSMDVELTIQGTTMKIKQNLKSIASKHNAIEKIEVPKEVIEQAIPMN